MFSLAVLFLLFAGNILFAQSPLTITTTALPNAMQYQPYSLSLAATGGTPPYSWTDNGLAIAGLRIDYSTGVISGMPFYLLKTNVTITVADTVGNQVSKTFPLLATTHLHFISTQLPFGSVGYLYQSAVAAVGGVFDFAYSIVTGALPPGLTF